ncbi:hypothetical protein BOTCAL_0131g00270 [Botryotinia calthae]|uniref:Uncharacterized protein n=1 Tax=Botryotinia calthae TaxID=38488 RepID=A0A4Y8D5Z9_9HELO|nr:hypothetical protein BOTCAL_0131g00270 [Botryotinia calthae]
MVSASDFSINNSCREDEPLLELLMGNNDNNTKTAAQTTLTGGKSSIIGEDELLLFALTLGQNNNNSAANYTITNAIPNTLDPKDFALELKAIGNEDDKDISVTASFNNNNGTGPRQKNVQPCLGTLHPTTALELKFPGKDDNDDMDDLSFRNDRDAPLTFVLLLDRKTANNTSNAPDACNSETPKANTSDLKNITLG